MIRLLGFVVGAALAIAAILLVLGVPEISPRPPVEPFAEIPEPPETAKLAEPVPQPESAPAEPPQPERTVAEPMIIEPAPTAVEPMWHSFWSPFGSQIAAQGFVKRLEAVTGYDYRVVKIENGVYEVTFAYASDDERLEKLATIASATGLEIPGS